MAYKTELYKFITNSKNANLTTFFSQFLDKFQHWHKSTFTVEEFLQFWENEFAEVYHAVYGRNIASTNPPSRKRLELCTTIVHTINLRYQKRQLKRTLEIEDLQLQNTLIQTSFKRLRSTVEHATSQNSSQNSNPSDDSYNPESEPELSETNEILLEPFWVFLEVNMSTRLNSFRSSCLEKMRASDVSSVEKISINHVFLVVEIMDFLGLDVADKKRLIECLDLNDSYQRLSQVDSQAILDIAYASSIECADKIKVKTITDLSANPSSSCLKTIFAIVENLARYDLNSVDESLFINALIDPVLDNAIDFKHLVKAGHFTELEGDSKLRPDIKYSYTLTNGQKSDLLVVEVKSPSHTTSDDFFKLSVELELMINRLVEAGVDSPEVYGIIAQGYSCSSYKMDLKAPLVYRMIKLKTFYLPRSLHDLHTLINTITCVRQINSLLDRQVSILSRINKHSISNTIEWIRLPVINV